MTAQIADEIGSDAPLHEAPLPVAAFEAVLVATADDRLQSHARQALDGGSARTRLGGDVDMVAPPGR
jgi:hypothetical protein